MSKLAIIVLAAALQLSSQFQPARVVSSTFGGFPYGSVAAGLVVLDVDVDQGGAVRGINTLKDLEPFGDVVRRSVSAWRFEPAREGGQAVEHPTLVAVLVRPAAVMFTAPPPPPGPPPGVTRSIPIPTGIGIPAYPPNRIGSAAVLVEVEIDFQGTVTSAQIKGEQTGFDDTSLEAARRWTFRPARHKNIDVASRAYLLFVFRQPAT